MFISSFAVSQCPELTSIQVYNKWKGCQCPKDTSYSHKWNKCVPDCKYGYVSIPFLPSRSVVLDSGVVMP
jgi:hypothetical protein